MPSLPFSQGSRNLYRLPGIDFAQVFIAFIVLLFSLTVHECAHAWTADRLGDPTARLLGRVSLNPVVHADLNGTVLFLADLIRQLSLPLRLDFMGVSSYGAGTESGELVFTKELRLDVRGRDVLLVDDILDTGKTLSRVIPKLRALKPCRIKVCVLLDKPARRVEPVAADYVGFEIPNVFVVGYGLDYAEKYRNLPFVGVLKPEMYRT